MKYTIYDSFSDLDEVQYFNRIKIYIAYPYSDVTFNKEDFEEACEVTSLKFLTGFNDYDIGNIYLNNKEIYKEELMFWIDTETIGKIEKDETLDEVTEIRERESMNIKLFINKYKNILNNSNNKFKVKLKNKDCYESIKNGIITKWEEL